MSNLNVANVKSTDGAKKKVQLSTFMIVRKFKLRLLRKSGCESKSIIFVSVGFETASVSPDSVPMFLCQSFMFSAAHKLSERPIGVV